MKGKWLLFIDLDGTLWDHKDISRLSPPFTRIGEDIIVDSKGVKVKLYRDMVELIRWARSSGAIISSLSWNIPEKALEALETFGLDGLFDYHGISTSPDKGYYAMEIINDLKSKGVLFKTCEIVYIDDRNIHLESVRNRLGNIIFIMAWKDFKNFREAQRIILEKTCIKKPYSMHGSQY